MSNQRTKKVFIPYNDYYDRPFGLKWGTAFAMDELVKGITKGTTEALKVNTKLKTMTRYEIDHILYIAFTKNYIVSVQLHDVDANGHLKDNIIGYFEGYADSDYLYIEATSIAWESINHISILR